MGDFNSNTPTARGMEWRPSTVRQYALDSPGRGLMMRIKPGSVTMANLDLFLSKIVGSPGLAVELRQPPSLDALPIDGPFSDSLRVPGTVGSVTGFTNQAGGAATAGEVSDSSDTTYLRNTSAVPAGSPIRCYFQSGIAPGGIYAKNRRVHVRARVRASTYCYTRLFLRIGGVNYFADPFLPTADFADVEASWYYNPATGLPWTDAEVLAFDVGTGFWGVEIQGTLLGTLPAQAFAVAQLDHLADQATEYRGAGSYTTSLGGGASPRWVERALSDLGPGLNTNLLVGSYGAWYYLHVFNWRNASGANYFTVPILTMPSGLVTAASSAATTGEHRLLYETTIGPGGEITRATPIPGAMIPILAQTSAPAINSQSQPYVDTPAVSVYSGSPTNWGGQITSAAITTYGGVRLPLGWQTLGRQPDAALTIELRHGAGAATGGGTLDATATVQPTDLADGVLGDTLVKFAVAIAVLATTQYVLRFVSTATNGRGWKVGTLDTRSDLLGSGVVTADVEGATQGGTTDALFSGGAAVTQKDLPAVLLAAPTGPASLTATPVAGL